MKKYLSIFIIACSLLIPNITSAKDISHDHIISYNNFVDSISEKYSQEEMLEFYDSFNETLSALEMKDKRNTQKFRDFTKLNNKHKFELEMTMQKDKAKKFIKKNPSIKKFKNIVYNPEIFFVEDKAWHTIKYKKYHSYPINARLNEAVFKKYGYDYATTFVYIGEKEVHFITDYTKYRLAGTNTLIGVPNTYGFLSEMRKIFLKYDMQNNYDDLLNQISDTTNNVIQNSYTQDQKIESIYAYIINNLKYDVNYDFKVADSFSGLLTYEEGSGVCEGYIKLFYYMLAYAGIEGETISGEIIASENFGRIGHIWMKIGDYYYDPTYDDPVNSLKDRSPEDYEYYKLPEDILYSDRYIYGSVPPELIYKSQEEREALVKQNYMNAYKKDKSRAQKYQLLSEAKFRVDNSLTATAPLTLLDISNQTKNVYTSDSLDTLYGEQGNKFNIKNIKYYKIAKDGKNIENLLRTLNYDLHDFTLIEVLSNDGSYHILTQDFQVV